MPIVTYVQADGSQLELEGVAGQSVMRLAVTNSVPGIVGECGGSMNCSTCHVFLSMDDGPNFPAPEEIEDEMLDGTAVARMPNSRLSCQLVVHDVDISVTVPERQY